MIYNYLVSYIQYVYVKVKGTFNLSTETEVCSKVIANLEIKASNKTEAMAMFNQYFHQTHLGERDFYSIIAITNLDKD